MLEGRRKTVKLPDYKRPSSAKQGRRVISGIPIFFLPRRLGHLLGVDKERGQSIKIIAHYLADISVGDATQRHVVGLGLRCSTPARAVLLYDTPGQAS